MSWLSAVSQLRDQLGDNPKMHLRYRQRVIGRVDGINTTFKTLDFRRVTSFLSSTIPEGVFVSGASAVVASDFPEVGEFTVTVAPPEGEVVEASFYVQWFLDSELEGYLISSAQWLGLGSDWLVIPDGLRPAAKFYASKQAMEQLSLRWSEYLSSTYLMEDAPRPEDKKNLEQYQRLAKLYWDQAESALKNFYTRSGQSLAPSFSSIPGSVRRVAPNR